MGLARSFHMFLQGIFFWQTMNSSKWYWSKVLLKKHWACSFKPGPTIVQPLKLEKSLCNSKRGYVTWRDVVWLKERLLDFMEVLWLDERLLDLSWGCMTWGEITRQGTSSQYQNCYLDLVIWYWYYLSVNQLFSNSEATMLSTLDSLCNP